MTSAIGKMEEEALKRKERLKALREKQQATMDSEKPSASGVENQPLPK